MTEDTQIIGEGADDADKKGQNQEERIKRRREGEHRKQMNHFPEKNEQDIFCDFCFNFNGKTKKNSKEQKSSADQSPAASKTQVHKY